MVESRASALIGRGRSLLLAAIGLCVLSLGMPWGITGAETGFVSGFYTAGSCIPEFSTGTMSCSPGFLAPGMVISGPGALGPGSASPARVALVAAIVLILVAIRSASRTPLVIAALALTVATVVYGSGLRSGTLVALLAAALLVIAWRRDRAPATRTAAA